MYTTLVSWIIAFFFLFLFAIGAGYSIGKKNFGAGWFVAFSVLFIFVATITVMTVESTIESEKIDSARYAGAYQRSDQSLNNRYNLSPGWYKVVQQPILREVFPEDTTKYVVLGISNDGIELEVAFPNEDWKLIPPKPEVKLIGERWEVISFPGKSIKEIRIENYEEKEYSRYPKVVEAKTYL